MKFSADIQRRIDAALEKAFKDGFEAGVVKAINFNERPDKLTFTYVRQELAHAAWKATPK